MLVKLGMITIIVVVYDKVITLSTPTRFTTLYDVINYYNEVLTQPYIATFPLYGWFQGEMSSEECAAIIAREPPGTFVIRFSSHTG